MAGRPFGIRVALLLAPWALLVACSAPPELAVEDTSSGDATTEAGAPLADAGSGGTGGGTEAGGAGAGGNPAPGANGSSQPGTGGSSGPGPNQQGGSGQGGTEEQGGSGPGEGSGGRLPSPLYIDPISAFGGTQSSFEADVRDKCQAATGDPNCIGLTFERTGFLSAPEDYCAVSRTEPDVQGKRVKSGTNLTVILRCTDPDGEGGGTGTGGTGTGETGTGETGTGETGTGETGTGETGTGETGNGQTGTGETGTGASGGDDTGGDTASEDDGS